MDFSGVPIMFIYKLLILFGCLMWFFPASAEENLPPWGIAVYMMPSDMIPEARKDFNEMAAIAAAHDIPIAVQWQTYESGTEKRAVRRALLTGGEDWYDSGTELPQGTKMSSRETFGDFLSWVQTAAPSEKRALVTWGHGGLEKGVGYEATDPLDVHYFTFDRMRGGAADAGYRCDLLVVCGCKGAVAEGVIAYAGFADSFTATTMDKIKLSSGLGPFDSWLEDLVSHPHWQAAEAGESWVERYRQTGGSYNTAIVMDLQQFTAPGGGLDQAAWVAAALHRREDKSVLVPLFQGMSANFQTSQNYSVLDDWLRDIAETDYGVDPSIQAAATAARQAMEDAVTHRWHGSISSNGLGIHTPWFENPPVSSPIPKESDFAVFDKAGFMETWIHEMPFINTFAYAYGDGSQQPNELKARVVEHHFDPDTRELRLRFNQPMVRASFDPAEDLDDDGSALEVASFTWEGYETLIVRLAELPSEPRILRLGPEIWDTHGLGMDQNGNGVAEESLDVFEAEIPAASETGVAYADWAQAQGIPGDLRGPADSPMGDEIPNLLKYASGLEAMTFHAPDDLLRIPDGTGAGRFAIRFYRSGTAVGAQVVPQRSDSLTEASWTHEGLTQEKLGEEGGRETWEVSMPLESHGFIRLKVETEEPASEQ